MTITFKTRIIQIIALTILTSCGDKDNAILDNKNFDEGRWLIVIEDAVQGTTFAIDDEKVLKENPFGLLLGPMAECGGTTCDGFLKLYKDGELISHQEYLSHSDLIEKQNLLDSYKKADAEFIYPENKDDYKRQWDSLLKIGNVYPTRYHTQPDDKDVILYYKLE